MKELIFHRPFLAGLRHHGSEEAIFDGEYVATLESHADRVFRLADALRRRLGVERGDRFAVLAENCHEYLETYHAAFLGAGVVNPLNVRLAERELDYIVRDSGARVIFVDARFAPVVESLGKAAGADWPVEHVVLMGAGEGACDVRYEALLAEAEPRLPEEPEEEDPVVLMYTGGTTGLPKGVLVTQRAEALNCYHVWMMFRRRFKGETQLLQTPMFHAASIVALLSVTQGGKLVLMPAFEPGAVISLVERHQVTMTTMVPTMIGMTFAHESFCPERLESLEVLAYGASPMPDVLLDRIVEMYPDLDLYQGYGMTEASSVLTLLEPADHRAGGARLRSVGRAPPGVMLCIQDEAGNEVPAGEVGEVCARGGNYMSRYWGKPEATEEVFRGGWYHTGDAGYVDEDGYLYLVDRIKDMIVTGAENVYSAEVENAIATHPAVLQVAVIGVPSDRWGEQVHAIVVPRPGTAPSEADIMEHARSRIAHYKVPKSVELRTEPLPLSGAMKVLKRELRKPYWEGQRRGIA